MKDIKKQEEISKVLKEFFAERIKHNKVVIKEKEINECISSLGKELFETFKEKKLFDFNIDELKESNYLKIPINTSAAAYCILKGYDADDIERYNFSTFNFDNKEELCKEVEEIRTILEARRVELEEEENKRKVEEYKIKKEKEELELYKKLKEKYGD